MVDLEGAVLGETAEPIALETSGDNHAAAVALVRQTRRTLIIFTHDLDARVYDTQEFADAVAALARRGRLSRIRILVQDTRPVIRSGHRLVDLAVRLSSYIEVRKVSREHEHYNRCGFVQESGEPEQESGNLPYDHEQGNHPHIHPDVRVIHNPQYMLFHWICI